ncbi:type II toxin-antitoxin system VapC family toxin [Roseicella aquatilis]|uniref:Ribonuclease VapC n=1 Tax=Roseicella aquatilis TaxID=2527868 RepID=A0A4R4DWV2_9PROT|nr:type II toxin-antitoxin system VapC family toxin [Roseicella aquatilis]TCZ65343.1 PIN domain-containing protein [Roseicella aquatilis]
MTLYLDTSLLVSASSVETETGRSQAWLASRSQATLAISPWVFTESSSAAAMKIETGQIDRAVRDTILARFREFAADTLRLLPIEPADSRRAAQYADQHALGLRSGDALHLAVCAAHGATLCTLDRRLADAGPKLGVPAELV